MEYSCNPSQLAEIITPPPRPLHNLQGELLFIEDSYLFHYQKNGKDVYKYLSPQALRLAFNNQPTDSQWLPPNLIRHGSSCYGEWGVLFFRAQRYELNFPEEQLILPLPSLVFMGRGQHYWLWAIAERQFNPQAQVFYAPLPNVNSSPMGRICWGSNSPPIANLHSLATAWHLFIRSQFTNHYADHKSRQFPRNIVKQLRKVSHRAQNSKRSRYPTSDLVAVGNQRTIAELIEAVLEFTP